MITFNPTWIDRVFELLGRSPLRQVPDDGRCLPESAALNSIPEISQRLQALRERVHQPLTVGVLGEVKAGKSTLINALVGADVAPVDVLEATQWVMVIRAGDTPRAVIHFSDGTTREGSPQEIHDLLFDQRHNTDFVSRCVEVVVSLPLPGLARWHLIDTPGLATVTEEAAARTQRHLTEVDAVLWVLNANHLGQIDVTSELAQVARLGKPIIAVINRVDEVDADRARLARYVRMRLAEYVQEVFAVSARQARQAQKENDPSLLEACGLPQLQTYLEQRVTGRAEEAQAESLVQQLLALLEMEHTVHDTYGHHLSFLLQEADNHRERLDIEAQRIQKEAESFLYNELERYVDGVAYTFAERIPASPRWDELFRGTKPVINEEQLQSALAGDGFRAWAEGLGPKVDAFVKERWEEAVGRIEVQLRQRFETFFAGEIQRLEGIEGLRSSPDLLEGLKEGLTSGGLIGAGLATYASALGPAAAYISFGAAIGSILPPALFIGAIAGVAMRYMQAGRQAERTRKSLQDAIMRHKQRLQSDWLRSAVFPSLRQHNAAVADTLHQTFTDHILKGWSAEELRTLAQDVDAHVKECETAGRSIRAEVPSLGQLPGESVS